MQPKTNPPLETAISPGLRRYLYFTAALTGAAILIVEILGAKMLSPYVGTSHFVWTAQIAVTLVSLATGYYYGGWLVDRSQQLARLFYCILVAAIYLSLTVAVIEPIAYWCLQFKLATGALIASAILFFVPLTLLATTGPFLVRVLTQSVRSVGGNVGRLSAVSTLGSVAGTVLIGYVLIPLFPNSVTMYLTAALLMAVTTGYFLAWGRPVKAGFALAAGMGLGLAVGGVGVSRESRVSIEDMTELTRANSNFGRLQVLQTGDGRRYYLNDFLTQNTYDPAEKKSISLFTAMLHGLAYAYTPQVKDVLCIGMGVGIVPMQFVNEGARVDVVEINPAVVPLAQAHFDLQPERFNLVIGDGRYFINRATKRYDAIILDAFLGDSSPSHLMTREAFSGMQRILRAEGVLVINSFGDFSRGKDFLTASLDRTLRAVFRSVRIHASGNGNVFFVASNQPELTLLNPPDLELAHPLIRHQITDAFASIQQVNPRHGRVLTDDFNPVDFYDAANRETIRRSLAASMRQR